MVVNNKLSKILFDGSHPNDKFYERKDLPDERDEFPIYVDVDGTLLDSNDNIIRKNLDKCIELYYQGYKLILWSYGGQSWAKRFVNLSDTEYLWDYVVGKPHTIFDNEIPSELLKYANFIDANI